ncbi:MAG: hypothetical protein IKF78_06285 [Atopobiaceae bacterium]|nr:hypothetical protein [Atopobiaceae bacterium]
MEEFSLGRPAVVCRWRLSNGRLPLENRHLRALAARKTPNEVITTSLVAWAKQHMEWTLADGTTKHPDGVLMLVVDTDGRAAMSVGAYHQLTHLSANDLLQRAQNARKEAQSLCVAPEELWVVRDDVLLWATSSQFSPAGACSLVYDLAKTLGMTVRRDEELLDSAATKGFAAEEVFLVSDEHGVVPASDRTGARAQKFKASYERLLSQA